VIGTSGEAGVAFDTEIQQFMEGLRRRNPGETEFHQAVEEVAMDIIPFTADRPRYTEMRVLERMTEPDRIIIFRVCWEDASGNIRVNRGYRIQCNNAIGPYKGGIRFHPSVNQSILKFLAFEQTFKNSLTGLPMGGGKGGSDFNPKGKTDLEVMRFCQSFMTELHRHIGADTDVPAGDIGVGAREVGYLFGQYKRLENRFEGVLTGKALEFGGSRIRVEATGYGVVYLMQNILNAHGTDIEGRTCAVSGSGNVATYCVEKINQLGGKVVTMSDSSGFVHDPDGISAEKLAWIEELKNVRRGRISEYADHFGCEFHPELRPWIVPCELAFPCATQNELEEADARHLVANSCKAVGEGANMPCTPDAVKVLKEARVLHAPAKAANAGGVSVSGLEMSQNSLRISWSAEEVDTRLKAIMKGIHDQCVEYGTEPGGVDYFRGANVAGFVKVANAMLAYGVM
jgi:glutamate dehydrogenase (NADP+)